MSRSPWFPAPRVPRSSPLPDPSPMEPLPETATADQLYGPFLYQDADLLEQLVCMGDAVRLIAPACVGLSLSLTEEGVTFTVVANGPRDALISEAQPPGGATCGNSVARDEAVAHDAADPLREESWSSYAAAASTAGMASTLSLPVRDHEVITGGFNLYGSTRTTFDGHHHTIARILGAWADGAVTNSDLDFTTRDEARQAPHLLRETTRLSVAAAMLALDKAMTVEEAVEELDTVASRAGVSLTALVDSMIDVFQDR